MRKLDLTYKNVIYRHDFIYCLYINQAQMAFFLCFGKLSQGLLPLSSADMDTFQTLGHILNPQSTL